MIVLLATAMPMAALARPSGCRETEKRLSAASFSVQIFGFPSSRKAKRQAHSGPRRACTDHGPRGAPARASAQHSPACTPQRCVEAVGWRSQYVNQLSERGSE